MFGVPDPRWGEVPVAGVVLHAGASLAAYDLVAWTNGRVAAKFQRLHSVQFVKDFPINVAGKTLKGELRRAYIAA